MLLIYALKSIHEINATWCFVEVWESGSKGKQCRKRREAERLREGGASEVWLEGKGNSTLRAVHRCNHLDWEVQMFHSQSLQTEWHGCSGQQGKGWSEMRRCRGRRDGSITWRIAEGREFDHPLMKENWCLPLLEWKEVKRSKESFGLTIIFIWLKKKVHTRHMCSKIGVWQSFFSSFHWRLMWPCIKCFLLGERRKRTAVRELG